MKNICNAYTEVLVILKNLDYAYYSIPIEIIEKMKSECNLNHNFKLQKDLPIQKQKLLDETKAILSVFFRDYWATEEQRNKILEKEKYDLKLLEDQKRKRYNPDDIFQKVNKNIEINNTTTLIECKESIFTRLRNRIFKILHINKKTN